MKQMGSHPEGFLAVWCSHSIVTHNNGGDCSTAVISRGYNLDSDGSCGLSRTSDMTADPLLAPYKAPDLITFNLSHEAPMITLSQSLPEITDSVTLDGSNNLDDGRVTISGNNQYRVFDVAADVTLRLQKLVIANGVAHGEIEGVTERGGGIRSDGILYIDNTVIQDNSTDEGGGVFSSSQGFMDLTGTIVANNQAMVEGGDCAGTVEGFDYNLDSDGSCNFTGMGNMTADPLLGPLQDDGGSTETMALLPGSPAIDVIPVITCSLPTDQRGVARPQDGNGDNELACDMGSFELDD